MVVRYEYLWQSREQQGESEGEKYRPCLIILAVPATDAEPAKAMVCAITHSRPRGDDIGIEIPDDAKTMMGLDGADQWVIVSEANLLNWNDVGLVQLSNGGWTYGTAPKSLAESVRSRYAAVYGDRGADAVINRPKLGR